MTPQVLARLAKLWDPHRLLHLQRVCRDGNLLSRSGGESQSEVGDVRNVRLIHYALLQPKKAKAKKGTPEQGVPSDVSAKKA